MTLINIRSDSSTNNHTLLRNSNQRHYEHNFWIPQMNLNSIENHPKNHRFQPYYNLLSPSIDYITLFCLPVTGSSFRFTDSTSPNLKL